jgi:hypothetical protein
LPSQERKGNKIVPITGAILASTLPHVTAENVCEMHDKSEIRMEESVSE